MNASVLTNEFLYKEEKNSINAIESISLMLKASKIDSFPFLFRKAFSLYLTIKLTFLNKKIKRVSLKVKEIIKSMSYEQARDAYAFLSKSNRTLSSLISDMDEPNHKHLGKVVYKLYCTSLLMLKELEETYSSVLFHKIDPTIPLTDKEKAAFAEFNEIWGDDDDEVYARDTHHRLTQGL